MGCFAKLALMGRFLSSSTPLKASPVRQLPSRSYWELCADLHSKHPNHSEVGSQNTTAKRSHHCHYTFLWLVVLKKSFLSSPRLVNISLHLECLGWGERSSEIHKWAFTTVNESQWPYQFPLRNPSFEKQRRCFVTMVVEHPKLALIGSCILPRLCTSQE